jgi:N-acetylated-alpha-linked acidic dipeptidase
MNKARTRIAFFALALAGPARLASAIDPPLIGFTPESSAAQRTLEERFDRSVRRSDIRDWVERLSKRPHHVGSPYGKDNAEWMAGLFKSWGYDTRIESFDVLFPTPRVRQLEMLSPRPFRAALAEPALAEDATSGQVSEQLPTYNAYSTDGDANRRARLRELRRARGLRGARERGIDVKGKIVIARYGLSWRGIKPKVAAEKGALGCLIYSDPRDDGYFAGDAYPKGGLSSRGGGPARLGGRHAALSGRPADAGRRRELRRRAAAAREGADAHEDPGAADLVRRRAAAARGAVRPGRARGVARRPADHLPPRARPGRVRLQLAFDWKRVPRATSSR